MKDIKTLNTFLERKDVTLTEEQYAYVVDCCFGETHVANWSIGGSGKSLCLEIIKEFLGDECIVCATTGSANAILFNNLGGNGTMASIFSLPLGIHNHYHEKKVNSVTTKIFATSDLVKYVIIEEAGMMNPDQLALILKRVRRYNKAYRGKRSERNIKIILQGDQLQLGAITSDREKAYMVDTYGDYFLPTSEIYTDFKFNTHIFSKVLRTKDKVLQSCLEVLRYGQKERYTKCIQWMNQRFVTPPDGIPVVTTTNDKVDRMNEIALAKNPNRLFELHPTITGNFDMKNCPVDKVVRVKIGSPVLILINDTQEQKYFNGSFGYVENVIVGEGVDVKLASNGDVVFVPMFEFDEREYYTDTDPETGLDFMNQRRIGTCLHYCIKLASAISVHRTQGKTFDSPYLLDLGIGFDQSQSNDWGKQLAYVSWSRTTKLEHVYLAQPMRKPHIKVDNKAVEWVLNNTGGNV